MTSVTALIYRSRVSEFHAFPSTSVTAPGCRVSETLHSQVSEKQPLAFPWLFTAFHPPASVLHTLFIPDVLVSAPATLCLFSCLCSYDHCHDCSHCNALLFFMMSSLMLQLLPPSILCYPPAASPCHPSAAPTASLRHSCSSNAAVMAAAPPSPSGAAICFSSKQLELLCSCFQSLHGSAWLPEGHRETQEQQQGEMFAHTGVANRLGVEVKG